MKRRETKNILVISTSLQTRGGISSVLKILLHSELKKKYNFYHLSSHKDGIFIIKIFYLIKSYLLFPIIIITKKIDLIDIHGSMRMSFLRKGYFLVVGKVFRIKTIYHMHSPCIDNYLNAIGKIKLSAIIRLFDLYDVIFALCSSSADVIQKWTNTPVRYTYNPVILPSTIASEATSTKFTVLTLGELGNRKGTLDILDVAKNFLGSNIQFKIGGNGDVDRYIELAKSMGIKDEILFLGWVDEKQREEEMVKADIYFLPSYNEGLPMSILEAIGYGIPIISTPVGCIEEIVENGMNGFLVMPGEIQTFTQKIQLLYENCVLRKTMGMMSRKIAEDKFSVENIIKEHDKYYSNILKS